MDKKEPNPVSAPAHYTGDGHIEAMAAMKSMMSVFERPELKGRYSPMSIYWLGCAFKYIWRWPLKNGLEDLKKCRQCLDYLIEELES